MDNEHSYRKSLVGKDLYEYRGTYLKDEFINLGYNVEVPVDGLLVVKNFLTEDEIEEYWEIINSSTQKDWEYWYTDGLKKFCLEKFGRDDVENLVKEGLYEITENWHDKNLEFVGKPIHQKISKRLNSIIKNGPEKSLICSGFYFIQRMYEGVQLVPHTDQFTDPSIKYAAVIYIHDDYNGGEIYWINKNFEMKPKPGDLLIFPGNDDFNHGVKHVLSGPTRYVIPSFIKYKDFYENNKYS